METVNFLYRKIEALEFTVKEHLLWSHTVLVLSPSSAISWLCDLGKSFHFRTIIIMQFLEIYHVEYSVKFSISISFHPQHSVR